MNAVSPIRILTPEIEDRIRRNPLLNMDTFIIPSPFTKDSSSRKDYGHSYVWIDEGEVLGFMLTYAGGEGKEFQIYKLVTSPFGRGRGIGTAFIERLAEDIPDGASVYLYIWEKQAETVEFFRNKGFRPEKTIVYRNLVYHMLTADRDAIVRRAEGPGLRAPGADEIGRTRHDARKILRLLGSMVNALAPENAGRVIEDINRETTTLMNMLNTYRDSTAMSHEVNVQDLILERLVPYVETSPVPCELILRLDAAHPVVLGHWLILGRALVNLASNALDAIAEADRKGVLEIALRGEDDCILLTIADNGKGMAEGLLEPDAEGRPAFIGRSTKADGAGEGLGTLQVWSAFGPERLTVRSVPGEGTTWTIRMDRSVQGLSRLFSSLQRRFHELQGLQKDIELTPNTPRNDVIAAIWQLRKREIFMADLIGQFSRHHNIRLLYRAVLSFLQGKMADGAFEREVAGWRGEHKALNAWLLATARWIRERQASLERAVDTARYAGALFKSYGQALGNIIIFTLDPESGRFLASDRKLAEHLDFVAYLDKDRDALLRGEFVGDVNDDANPIYFGVWSVESEEDLGAKLRLIRRGARALVDFGLHPAKRLAFYQTTYVRHDRDIDADASTTIGEIAALDDDALQRFVRDSEDEMRGFLAAVD